MKKAVIILAVLLVASILVNVVVLCKHHTPPSPEQQNPPATPAVPQIPSMDNPPEESDTQQNIFSSAWFEDNYDSSGSYVLQGIYAYFSNLTINPSLDEIKIYPKPLNVTGVSRNRNTIKITGSFELDTDYTVILPENIIFSIKGKTPTPSVQFSEQAHYYPLKPGETGEITSWMLPVRSMNLESCKVELYRQSDRNLALPIAYNQEEYMEFIGELEIKLPKSINKQVMSNIDLSPLIKGQKNGFYKVVLINPKSECLWSSNMSCDIIISDLGYNITYGSRTAAVSVHSLTTFEPVSNANVRLVSRKHDIIATAFTDENGTARLSFKPEFDAQHDSPDILIVSTDNDISFIKLEYESMISNSPFQNNGNPFKNTPDAFITPERGIYRPGETAELAIIIRQFKDNQLSALETSCFLSVSDAHGNSIFKQRIQTDRNGTALQSVQIPVTAHSGTFTAKCGLDDHNIWGTTSFIIGDFTPDRIKFKASPTSDVIYANQPLTIDFSADYYYGTPVQNPEIEGALFLTPAKFPKHWLDYSVGTAFDNKYFRRHVARFPKRKFNEHDNIVFPLDLGDYSVPLQLSAVMSLTEEGSRSVSATASAIYLPASQFIGMKYNSAKKAIETAILDWSQDNKPALPVKLTMEWEQLDWNYIKVNNSFQWILETVASGKFDNMTLVEQNQAFTLPSSLVPGFYSVTVKNADDPTMQTNVRFWHSNGDAGSVYTSNPAILTVKADKETYQPGDTAEITFNSLSAGFASIFAGERDIAFANSIIVAPGSNTTKITIPNDLTADTCFAAITMVSTMKEETSRSFALLKLKVDNSRFKLPVVLTVPDKASPDVPLSFTVEAPAGSSIRAWAVDEGILALTSFATPDPFKYFHGTHLTAFNSFDIFSQLFSNQAIRPPKQIGGDGETPLTHILKNELPKNAIYSFPNALMPESGKITLSFTPADFNGSLRIMVLAADNKNTASADSSVTVKSPIVLFHKAPAAVAPNDKFPLQFRIDAADLGDNAPSTCIITTDTKRKPEEGKFLLALSLPDGVTATDDPAIASQSENHVIVASINVQAMKNGNYKIPYSLTDSNGLSMSGTIPVSVRSLLPAMTSLQTAIIQPGETWSPANLLQLLQPAKLTLASTPAVSISECISWLESYPYDCLEQTVSSVFPFLSLKNCKQEPFANFPNGRVLPAVVKLLQMQRGSRGFVSWPKSNTIWDDASFYAAHFLLALNPDCLNDSIRKDIFEFLSNAVRESPVKNSAYAAYILSFAGKQYAQQAATWAKIALNYETTPSVNSILAAAALIQSGYASEATLILTSAAEKSAWEIELPDTTHWMFQTKSARRAISLLVLVQYAQDSMQIHSLAKSMISMLRKDGNLWGTTKDNAFASAALILYQERFPSTTINGSISLDGNETPFTTESTFELNAESFNGTLIRNSGNTPVYVTLTALTDEQVETKTPACVTVTKEILKSDGTPATDWKPGELLTIRLSFTSTQRLENAAIEDRLAGCFEIEDGRLATRADAGADLINETTRKNMLVPTAQDSRCDRYLFFTSIPDNSPVWLSYNVRVISDGTFSIPPAHVEDMYNPDLQGTSPVAR